MSEDMIKVKQLFKILGVRGLGSRMGLEVLYDSLRKQRWAREITGTAQGSWTFRTTCLRTTTARFT